MCMREFKMSETGKYSRKSKMNIIFFVLVAFIGNCIGEASPGYFLFKNRTQEEPFSSNFKQGQLGSDAYLTWEALNGQNSPFNPAFYANLRPLQRSSQLWDNNQQNDNPEVESRMLGDMGLNRRPSKMRRKPRNEIHSTKNFTPLQGLSPLFDYNQQNYDPGVEIIKMIQNMGWGWVKRPTKTVKRLRNFQPLSPISDYHQQNYDPEVEPKMVAKLSWGWVRKPNKVFRKQKNKKHSKKNDKKNAKPRPRLSPLSDYNQQKNNLEVESRWGWIKKPTQVVTKQTNEKHSKKNAKLLPRLSPLITTYNQQKNDLEVEPRWGWIQKPSKLNTSKQNMQNSVAMRGLGDMGPRSQRFDVVPQERYTYGSFPTPAPQGYRNRRSENLLTPDLEDDQPSSTCL